MARILLCQKLYDCIYQETNGTISHQTSKYLDYRFDKLKEIYLACGYKWFPENSAYSVIEPYVGKNISDFHSDLKLKAERAAKKRIKRSKKIERWRAQIEEKIDVILSVREVEQYDCGYNVWVLLNSKYSYEQQRILIKEMSAEIVSFIIEELQNRRRKPIIQFMELMPFMTFVGADLSHQNEAVFRFELKQQHQKRFDVAKKSGE